MTPDQRAKIDEIVNCKHEREHLKPFDLTEVYKDQQGNTHYENLHLQCGKCGSIMKVIANGKAEILTRQVTAALEMQSAEVGSGFGEKHEAHRYRQIHEAVEKMGGWANYSYWAKRHSVEYFKLCENQEAKIAQLQHEVERLKNTYKNKLQDRIDLLQTELAASQEQLARAESVISFYADKDNWDGFEKEYKTEIQSDDWDVTDVELCEDGIGGKRAREYFKAKG